MCRPDHLAADPDARILLAAHASQSGGEFHPQPRRVDRGQDVSRTERAAGGRRRAAPGGAFRHRSVERPLCRYRQGAAPGLPLRPDRLRGHLAPLAALGLRLPPAGHLSAQPRVGNATRSSSIWWRLCKKNGVLFAPHDNYVDFYPDSEGFTYDNIAFTADRQAAGGVLQPRQPAPSPTTRARTVSCPSSSAISR